LIALGRHFVLLRNRYYRNRAATRALLSPDTQPVLYFAAPNGGGRARSRADLSLRSSAPLEQLCRRDLCGGLFALRSGRMDQSLRIPDSRLCNDLYALCALLFAAPSHRLVLPLDAAC